MRIRFLWEFQRKLNELIKHKPSTGKYKGYVVHDGPRKEEEENTGKHSPAKNIWCHNSWLSLSLEFMSKHEKHQQAHQFRWNQEEVYCLRMKCWKVLGQQNKKVNLGKQQ